MPHIGTIATLTIALKESTIQVRKLKDIVFRVD